MDPFPTKKEISTHQATCHRAWNLSLLAFGQEKMELIAQAHPHAITHSAAEGPLYFHWHPEQHAFEVCDYAGFITMIPEEDLYVLAAAIKMEYHQAGAFRELITGKKASPKHRPKPKPVRTQKIHISLGDLGL